MQLCLPLLAYPWLGRVLGPEAFGLLMYMCLIPPIIALVMDWGLPLGAARAAALGRHSQNSLRLLLGDVFAAKILLAFTCAAGCALLAPFLPHAAEWPGAYALAALAGISRGLSPVWFFQGTSRHMEKMALWDAGASFIALLLVFLLIRKPEQWPFYLFLAATCKGLPYLWLNGRLWVSWKCRLSFHGAIKMLKSVNPLFTSSFSGMIYTFGAQLLVGCFLPASQMGILVAVNKMVRALASVANPLTQTLFPQICSLGRIRPEKALTVALAGASLAAGFIILAAAFGWLFAPLLIKLALGSKYAAGGEILRIMLLATPLAVCNYALGAQILVAFGLEKSQAIILALMAALSLGLACLLPLYWGMTGAAWLSVLVEGGICCSYFFIIWIKRGIFKKGNRNF